MCCGRGVGRVVTVNTVDGVVSGGGVFVREIIASVGTRTDECISGLSVYVAPLLTDTLEVADFLSTHQGSYRKIRPAKMSLIHRLICNVDQVCPIIYLAVDAIRIPSIVSLLVAIQINPFELSLVSPLGHISQ